MRCSALIFLLFFGSLFADSSFIIEGICHSPAAIQDSEELVVFKKPDEGHYKTVVSCEQLPLAEKYYFKVRRSVIGRKTFETMAELNGKKILDMQDAWEQKKPSLVISSRGFAPGEPIEVMVETDKGEKSNVLKLIPFPLEGKMEGGIQVVAELSLMYPAAYNVSFKNVEREETLLMESVSNNETLQAEIEICPGFVNLMMPGVKGLTGGAAQVTYKRLSGEKLKLSLPWGDTLDPYFLGKKLPLN